MPRHKRPKRGGHTIYFRDDETRFVDAPEKLSDYKISHDNCGRHRAFWHQASFKYPNGNIKYVNFCPDCYELSKRKKRCNRCGLTFTPGCNVRHLCNICKNLNSHHKITDDGQLYNW